MNTLWSLHSSFCAEDEDSPPAQLYLEFRVFLVNSSTGRYTQEKRVLSFWFKEDYIEETWRAAAAQEFFKRLVSPVDFPRGTVKLITSIIAI